MIKIRFKKINSGKFSVYLDIYSRDEKGIPKRFYDFLGIYVAKDYSKVKRIIEDDKEKMRFVNAIKAKREIEMINSNYGFKNKSKSTVDILSVLEKLNKNQDHNLKAVIIKLKQFTKKDYLPFYILTKEFLIEFRDYLLSQINENTARTYLRRLSAYFNKAVRNNMIPENPLNGIKLPIVKEPKIEILTLEELKKLESTKTKINPMIRNSFLFACFTGLRYSDIKRLRWDDIEENQIILRPAKTTNTKGDLLFIPLSEQAKKILESMKNNKTGDRIFEGLPINSHSNKMLKRWAKEAGIKKNLHFHISRHTFGTLGITYGIDVYTMQKLLGHSNIDMTKHYAKIVNKKLKSEISKLPVIE